MSKAIFVAAFLVAAAPCFAQQVRVINGDIETSMDLMGSSSTMQSFAQRMSARSARCRSKKPIQIKAQSIARTIYHR
jgi:hypothetical protein